MRDLFVSSLNRYADCATGFVLGPLAYHAAGVLGVVEHDRRKRLFFMTTYAVGAVLAAAVAVFATETVI